MLLVWIILFSLCGLAIVSQFFENYDAQTKVFFGVYVAFWLFFEFKVIYAYRWRKQGEEKIILENGQLSLIKTTTANQHCNQIIQFEYSAYVSSLICILVTHTLPFEKKIKEIYK